MRSDNRLPEVLAEAARAFRAKGYDAASIRDIVGAITCCRGRVLPLPFQGRAAPRRVRGRRTALLRGGVRRHCAARRAVAQLEAACIAHLESAAWSAGSVRLMLLGALNWSQTWYRSGRDDPRSIARQVVALLRQQLDDDRRS